MMDSQLQEDQGLWRALVSDGRPLLHCTGLSLILAGAFALFLSATGHFLPHDVRFLGMEPKELCAINECRIVHFMIHDRVSFGGTLVAVGTLYLWLVEFPLKRRQPWAWWLLLVSGILGFSSFLAYLGYGYLDTWHGVATLVLLPCFAVGMLRSFATLPRPTSMRCLLEPGTRPPWRSAFGLGRVCLLTTSMGLLGAGLTIMTVGMTTVFVPQDLEFMGLTANDLHAINPRLIPLIAHDRAGFGGGVATAGVLTFFCTWCGAPTRSLWEALAVAGSAGFGTAVGVHFLIGYVDFIHLAPAVLGALSFAAGLALTCRQVVRARKKLDIE